MTTEDRIIALVQAHFDKTGTNVFPKDIWQDLNYSEYMTRTFMCRLARNGKLIRDSHKAGYRPLGTEPPIHRQSHMNTLPVLRLPSEFSTIIERLELEIARLKQMVEEVAH